MPARETDLIMLFLAIITTVAAVLWALTVLFANGMRSSPGAFQGGGAIVAAFGCAAVLWMAWLLG